VVVVVLAAVAVPGCGGGDEASPEAQVRAVFGEYNAALADGDYGAACERLAPETVAKLDQNAARLGIGTGGGCAATLERVVDRAAAQGEIRLDEVAETARVKQVTVTGDAAVIEWSAVYDGRRVPISQSARRVDGSWKLVDVSN